MAEYIIEPVICQDNAKEIISKIRDTLKEKFVESALKDIYIADSSDNQVVILMSNAKISEQVAKVFWAGFHSALGEG